jgi:hypothetical protein
MQKAYNTRMSSFRNSSSSSPRESNASNAMVSNFKQFRPGVLNKSLSYTICADSKHSLRLPARPNAPVNGKDVFKYGIAEKIVRQQYSAGKLIIVGFVTHIAGIELQRLCWLSSAIRKGESCIFSRRLRRSFFKQTLRVHRAHALFQVPPKSQVVPRFAMFEKY